MFEEQKQMEIEAIRQGIRDYLRTLGYDENFYRELEEIVSLSDRILDYLELPPYKYPMNERYYTVWEDMLMYKLPNKFSDFMKDKWKEEGNIGWHIRNIISCLLRTKRPRIVQTAPGSPFEDCVKEVKKIGIIINRIEEFVDKYYTLLKIPLMKKHMSSLKRHFSRLKKILVQSDLERMSAVSIDKLVKEIDVFIDIEIYTNVCGIMFSFFELMKKRLWQAEKESKSYHPQYRR